MICGGMSAELEARIAAWLPRQRWFGGQSAAITGVRILDQADMHPLPAVLRLVEVRSANRRLELYQLVSSPGDLDALGDESVRARLYELLSTGARLGGDRGGAFEFEPFEPLPAPGASRPLGAEQSNTSLLYASAAGEPGAVLKLFRRLQPGENPEAEIPRALARYCGFSHVPRAFGEIRYLPGGGGESWVLAVMQGFVPNQSDGWSWVLRRLGEAPAGFAGWEQSLHQLGVRTAELHRALASIPLPEFAPEPVSAADVAWWRARAGAGLEPDFSSEYARILAPWRAELAAGAAGAEAALGTRKTRIHGDYHLGQVLRTAAGDAGDFVLFDFEGEPARPMADRRRKGSPWQDVAGMLRSFSYAAHTGNRPDWEAPARAAFLAGYGAPPPALAPLLRFFEIEKAVYELRYELDHRPAWAQIPLAGLNRLLSR